METSVTQDLRTQIETFPQALAEKFISLEVLEKP